MADAKTDFGTNIPQKIADDPDKFKAMNCIFLMKITGDEGGTWTLNFKDAAEIKEGEQDDLSPDCTIEMASEDWKSISENPQAAMQLYFQGKLKVQGNAMLATKLGQILG